MVRWTAGAIVAGVCSPALAAATDYTVNDDTSGPGPAGANCATPNFTAIEAGIDAAAASGDRLLVCAGTYTEPDNQILIDKSIAIIGTGVGQSIIDGQNATGMPGAGLLRTTDSTNGDVTVRGFTVQGAGQNGTGASTARFAFNLLGNDPGFTYLVEDVRVVGRGSGGRDYGFYGQNADQDVVLRDSTFVDQAYNPILIERVTGEVTVDNVTVDKPSYSTGASIFAFTHTGDNVTKPWSFTDNQIDANGTGGGISVQTGLGSIVPATLGPVTVSGNEVSDYATGGIGVANVSPAADGLNGRINDVTFEGNTLTPDPAALATSFGLRFQGLVTDASATGNRVDGAGRAVVVENAIAGHFPSGVDLAFNRFGDNTTGLSNTSGAAVTAENNWWGCEEGPADASEGCAPVVDTSTGVTDFDPWMVLGVTAAPTSIETGGQTSTVSLDLSKNSDGVAPAGNVLPGPFDVNLSTDLGTVSPATVTLDSDYKGSATLTSGATPGTATVTAGFEAADPTAQVEFTEPPPPPPVEPNDCGNPAKGTDGPDLFEGTPEQDGFVGRGGDDKISGAATGDCLAGQGGDDHVRGEAGDDNVKGGGGEDRVQGGADNDNIRGNGGADSLQGGGGDDTIRAGSQEDRASGGSGDDSLRTRDTFADIVNCGAGDDEAIVDRHDEVSRNCEDVNVG
ncbi:MAG: hypothetical protein U0R24_10435 [Solirubrobacterales bacterium]